MSLQWNVVLISWQIHSILNKKWIKIKKFGGNFKHMTSSYKNLLYTQIWHKKLPRGQIFCQGQTHSKQITFSYQVSRRFFEEFLVTSTSVLIRCEFVLKLCTKLLTNSFQTNTKVTNNFKVGVTKAHYNFADLNSSRNSLQVLYLIWDLLLLRRYFVEVLLSGLSELLVRVTE
jgi:hypothetical protein